MSREIPAYDYDFVMKVRKGTATKEDYKKAGWDERTMFHNPKESFLKDYIDTSVSDSCHWESERDLYIVDVDKEQLFVRAKSNRKAKDIAIHKYILEAGYEPEEIHAYKITKEMANDRLFLDRMEIIDENCLMEVV